MKIYRLEKDGRGPYTSGAIAMAPNSIPMQRNPEPCEEEALKPYAQMGLYSGFTNPRQMTLWFGGALLNYLFSQGFKISVYEVDTAYASKTQALFSLKKSTLLFETTDIRELNMEYRKECLGH